ncbi:MAG TPA: VOC family protein [Thermoplasmata archaeon]|nr:VOC family protein [Thermoplasmata archaeon]
MRLICSGIRVRDVTRSMRFYESIGFRVVKRG